MKALENIEMDKNLLLKIIKIISCSPILITIGINKCAFMKIDNVQLYLKSRVSANSVDSTLFLYSSDFTPVIGTALSKHALYWKS